MFYDNFVALCASVNKTPAYVGRELGIDKSTISCWKARKTKPSDVNAQKVADYFGVTVEELMGEGIKKERPAEGGTLDREAQNKLFRQLVDNTDDLGSLLEMLDTINKKMQELK